MTPGFAYARITRPFMTMIRRGTVPRRPIIHVTPPTGAHGGRRLTHQNARLQLRCVGPGISGPLTEATILTTGADSMRHQQASAQHHHAAPPRK
jgi:hypothetical protein